MNALHSAAFIIGIAVGAFLGHRWAAARNRNALAWALAGAVLPVIVVALLFLKPLPAPVDDDAEDTVEEVEA